MSPRSVSGTAAVEGKGCRFSSCVQLFVDGELDPGRAMDVETHLADCDPCAERAELLRSMKASLRRTCGGRASASLKNRISLAVVREAAMEAGAAEAVAAHETMARDSLLHGLRESGLRDANEQLVEARGVVAAQQRREHERTARGNRVAYGVGAIALAAGVMLALLGERMTGRDTDPTASEGADGAHDAETMARGLPRSKKADLREATAPTQASGLGFTGAPLEVAARSGVDQPRRDDHGLDEPGLAQPVMAQPVMVRPGEFVQVEQARPPAGPNLAPAARADDPTRFDTVLDDLAALHANPLPPETTNPDELRRFEPIVGVKLRRPTLRSYDARFRGARLHALRDAQRAAMLQYILRNDHRVTVYLFDPRAIPFGATRMQRRIVHEEPVYVGQFRGYSIAAAQRRGIGYAVATDLDTDESVKMVASAMP